jgi:hypothetical protein
MQHALLWQIVFCSLRDGSATLGHFGTENFSIQVFSIQVSPFQPGGAGAEAGGRRYDRDFQGQGLVGGKQTVPQVSH